MATNEPKQALEPDNGSWETEDLFDILENERGELMLVLPARKGEPERPCLFVDERFHAVFARDRHLRIYLPGINIAVADTLCNAKTVYVAEMDYDTIADSYESQVRKVDEVPWVNK